MKKSKKIILSILPEKMSICHFAKNSIIPQWALEEKRFVSIAKTVDELSIICPEDKIPGGVLCEKNWRVFKVEGTLGFVATGIVAGFSTPLAKAKISILYVSTYETDYILVGEKDIGKAVKVLGKTFNIKK